MTERKTISPETLYEMLYDSDGNLRSTSQQVALKDFSLDSKPLIQDIDHTATLAAMRLNKQFKPVNLVPDFKAVPATSHLFDLAGGQIAYDQEKLQAEASQHETKSYGGSILSGIGSLFGRK